MNCYKCAFKEQQACKHPKSFEGYWNRLQKKYIYQKRSCKDMFKTICKEKLFKEVS